MRPVYTAANHFGKMSNNNFKDLIRIHTGYTLPEVGMIPESKKIASSSIIA